MHMPVLQNKEVCTNLTVINLQCEQEFVNYTDYSKVIIEKKMSVIIGLKIS